ncbi:MAG: hypothetical protein ABL927_09465 [Bdellovibrionales bacterium]
MKAILMLSIAAFLGLTSKSLNLSQENTNREHWSIQEGFRFSFFKSLYRTQGIAADNEGHFWFSSWTSLVSTNSKTGFITYGKTLAIPYSLLKLGARHIGDVSYADGKIFAPIEDGAHYAHPHIVVYDAKTLQVQKKKLLPIELQSDGVPWVAASRELGAVFSSEYSNMSQVNIYDFDTLEPIGFVKPNIILHSVQGGEYHNGFLYLTANAPESGFSIYKMNLQTGEVIEVAQLPKILIEVEGLAFNTEQGVEKILVLGIAAVKENESKFDILRRRMALYTYAAD